MLSALIVSFFALSDAAKNSLDILVMGDWGGSPNKPYTTADEVDTAKIMGEIGSDVAVDAVWGLGDNFYNDGVVNEYDPRFKETFEDVFTASSLLKIPFYIIAGNHDHHQNVSGEIYYSNHSDRWTYPDNWYNVKWTIPNTNGRTLEVVMIDTVTLSGMSDDWEYCQSHNILYEDCPIHPGGPEDPLKAQSQWQWINSTMQKSTADYLIVAGHYPIYSIAEHGSTSDLVKKLNPMMKQYKSAAYFSGHDHTFEYIEDSGVGYVDTGGAHVCNPSTSNTNTIPKNSLKFHGCENGGFTRITVNETAMYVYYYYGSSTKIQYQTKFESR
eukprot:526684_1